MDKHNAKQTQVLVTKCITHLQREERLLLSLQAIADGMREALKSREYLAIEEISQSSVHDELLQITKDRGKLQAQMSEFFEVPPEAATLSLLVEHAGTRAANGLLEMQTRLRESIEGLNRSLVATGNLARYLHELIECVFRSLGGEAAASIVYERSGRHRV